MKQKIQYLGPRTSPLFRQKPVVRLLIIALLAEIGYAVLNLSAMPVYLKFDRGYDEDVIGFVLVAFLLSEALFKGPMGQLADRFGRKRLIVIGPAISLVTSVLTILIPHNIGAWETVSLVSLRILDGLGAAMLWPAAFALMGDTVEDGQRQEAMSLLNMCYLGGIGLAFLVGGVINDVSGERYASLVFSAILFVGVAIAAYRLLPSGSDQRASFSKSSPEGGGFQLSQLVETARAIPAYLTLAVATFMAIGFPMAIIKIFAKEQFGLTESGFGLIVLPGLLAMMALSVPMSKLGERMGRARAVHRGLALCSFGMAMIALGAFVPSFRSLWVVALGGIPVGIGFLLTIPAWFASVADLDPNKRAANLGAIMTAQGVGAIIGAPLGSLLYARLPNLDPDFGRYSPFLGCAICLIFGWILSLRILKADPPSESVTIDKNP
ncbi:MAG TPA: MFS transporter [Fimbriimonadaceae bacterium]|nr:MFS transporter [Fimbriimonadaceae bacterium]HRJ33490.1 MFS transporter [Fimbriimonadaceae bacterium]